MKALEKAKMKSSERIEIFVEEISKLRMSERELNMTRSSVDIDHT